MSELIDRIGGIGIEMTYDTKLIAHIVTEVYNPEYGARPVRRYIQDRIEDVIAEAIVEKKSRKTLHLTLDKKTITFIWK